MMEAVAAPKSLRLERDVPAALPAIRCDRARVQQVLSNLVGNAIKFAPKGSAIRIAAAASAREVRFDVSDQGPGIAEEEAQHLFDRYWRGGADGATGAGLGLYIAKGIVDAHGGRIWVETQAGAGATFCFTLPVAA
jgi:signal transduction histidine kinase